METHTNVEVSKKSDLSVNINVNVSSSNPRPFYQLNNFNLTANELTKRKPLEDSSNMELPKIPLLSLQNAVMGQSKHSGNYCDGYKEIDYQNELSLMEKQLLQKSKQFSQLEQICKDLQREKDSAELQITEKDKVINKYQMENDTVKKLNIKLESEGRKQLEKLKMGLEKELEEKINEKTREFEQASFTLKEEMEEKLNENLKELNREKSQISLRNEELEYELKKAFEKINSLKTCAQEKEEMEKAIILNLETRLTDLQSSSERQVNEWDLQKSQYETQILNLKNENLDLTEELDEVSNKLKESEMKIANYESYQEASDVMPIFKRNIQEIKEICQQLEEQVEEFGKQESNHVSKLKEEIQKLHYKLQYRSSNDNGNNANSRVFHCKNNPASEAAEKAEHDRLELLKQIDELRAIVKSHESTSRVQNDEDEHTIKFVDN